MADIELIVRVREQARQHNLWPDLLTRQDAPDTIGVPSHRAPLPYRIPIIPPISPVWTPDPPAMLDYEEEVIYPELKLEHDSPYGYQRYWVGYGPRTHTIVQWWYLPPPRQWDSERDSVT